MNSVADDATVSMKLCAPARSVCVYTCYVYVLSYWCHSSCWREAWLLACVVYEDSSLCLDRPLQTPFGSLSVLCNSQSICCSVLVPMKRFTIRAEVRGCSLFDVVAAVAAFRSATWLRPWVSLSVGLFLTASPCLSKGAPQKSRHCFRSVRIVAVSPSCLSRRPAKLLVYTIGPCEYGRVLPRASSPRRDWALHAVGQDSAIEELAGRREVAEEVRRQPITASGLGEIAIEPLVLLPLS